MKNILGMLLVSLCNILTVLEIYLVLMSFILLLVDIKSFVFGLFVVLGVELLKYIEGKVIVKYCSSLSDEYVIIKQCRQLLMIFEPALIGIFTVLYS